MKIKSNWRRNRCLFVAFTNLSESRKKPAWGGPGNLVIWVRNSWECQLHLVIDGNSHSFEPLAAKSLVTVKQCVSLMAHQSLTSKIVLDDDLSFWRVDSTGLFFTTTSARLNTSHGRWQLIHLTKRKSPRNSNFRIVKNHLAQMTCSTRFF